MLNTKISRVRLGIKPVLLPEHVWSIYVGFSWWFKRARSAKTQFFVILLCFIAYLCKTARNILSWTTAVCKWTTFSWVTTEHTSVALRWSIMALYRHDTFNSAYSVSSISLSLRSFRYNKMHCFSALHEAIIVSVNQQNFMYIGTLSLSLALLTVYFIFLLILALFTCMYLQISTNFLSTIYSSTYH